MAWIKHIIVCIFMLSAMLPVHVSAEEHRLALVIGNSDYQESALRNPKNDASDMANVLKALGFDVTVALDLDGLSMDKTIRQFGRDLEQNNGIGFFYYAGHGVQVEGNNFLIPVDSNIADEDEIRFKSIAVESVLNKMQRANSGLNILVLDACRNNPFPSSVRAIGANRGLARLDAPSGSIVVYSTSPGSVSEDGEGRNGTFTGHFIKYLQEPGLTLTQTIRRTRKAVREATGNKQNPWTSSNLTEDEYVLLPQKASIDVETIFWRSVTIGHTVDQYAAYLAAYPEGQFIDIAKSNVQALQNGSDVQVATNSKNIDEFVVAMIQPEPIRSNSRGPVTVDVRPRDARVRIMNIVERYSPGMMLEKNREYDIYIQKDGYASWRETVFIDTQTDVVDVSLAPISTPTPPSIFANNSAWRRIDSGTFTMGCSSGDRQCKTAEKPATTVNVTPYQISESEVTLGEFKQFVSATDYKTDAETNAGGYTGCYIYADKGGISRDNASWQWQAGANWKNPGFTQTDHHPVTCISWNDAVAYTQWLSRNSGRTIRLPTEAEWEFASRSGTSNKHGSAGTSRHLCDYENGADRTKSPTGTSWTDKLKCSDGYWNTAPVKSFKPNEFGLHDMLGNVREWTLDVWQDTLPQLANSSSPNTVGSEDERVLRGSAWDGAASKLRVSARSRGYKASRAAMTGFRIVRENAIQASK